MPFNFADNLQYSEPDLLKGNRAIMLNALASSEGNPLAAPVTASAQTNNIDAAANPLGHYSHYGLDDSHFSKTPDKNGNFPVTDQGIKALQTGSKSQSQGLLTPAPQAGNPMAGMDEAQGQQAGGKKGMFGRQFDQAKQGVKAGLMAGIGGAVGGALGGGTVGNAASSLIQGQNPFQDQTTKALTGANNYISSFFKKPQGNSQSDYPSQNEYNN